MRGSDEPDLPARGDEDGWTERLPGEEAGAGMRARHAAEAPYHLFVERVHDYAVFLMDAEGRITHWGEGAQRMKEFTPAEVLGKHLRDLYPAGGSEDGTADEHLRIAAEEGEYIGEGTRLARDRGLFPARVVLTALRSGGRLHGFSKVAQDLTERRKTEEALREAVRAAEVANEEKSRFLATMSHEIRTPINGVLGYADLLALEVAGPLTGGQRAYVERLRTSSQHLLALLEDVLDFAKVDVGRLSVDRRGAMVGPAAQSAAEVVGPLAEARGIALELACPADTAARYWGDERRVHQILVNLLGNAVKFTPSGGLVRISCGQAAQSPREREGVERWTWVRVEDTGIGIAEAQQEAVFEPFVQLSGGLTRTHEGTGLGLAIARRLARLMDGELTVESAPGAGSAFTLWLPVTEPPPARGEAEEGKERLQSLTRIGRELAAAAPEVVAGLARRLRADPATPAARERTLGELEDHLPTLVTDVAQLLLLFEQNGQDASSIAQDGREVQLLIARLHGQQRRRLGWDRRGIEREYEILRDAVEDAVHRQDGVLDSSRAEALGIIARLLGRAERESIRAWEE